MYYPTMLARVELYESERPQLHLIGKAENLFLRTAPLIGSSNLNPPRNSLRSCDYVALSQLLATLECVRNAQFYLKVNTTKNPWSL